jgi:hypothetical protein
MLHNRSLKHTAGIIELRLEFGHALVPIDLNRVSQQTLFEDIRTGRRQPLSSLVGVPLIHVLRWHPLARQRPCPQSK